MRIKVNALVTWGIASWLSVAGLIAAGDLRLLEAVRNKNTEAARALLKQHVDVNIAQGDGSTALHWAVHWDDLATADLLIRAGAHVNAANDLGVTPLSLACTNANAPMVQKLLMAGANANAAASTGETPLMTAARTGNLDVVRALLTHGANVNTEVAPRGQTALMWAVAQRHSEIVRVLIEAGADIQARSRVSTLVVNRGDPGGGRSDVGEVNKGGSTPLLFAARVGDLESAKLLLAAGANVNDAAPDGTSALVMAAHSGHGTLAAFLLDKGADPNAASAGYAALHAAVLRGDHELVNALLAHRANPNAQITRGTPVRRTGQDLVLPNSLIGATPFWLAAKFVEVGIMRVLAAHGADPLSTMKDGTTPLMAAAGIGSGAVGGAEADRRGVAVLDGGHPVDESRVLEAVRLSVELGADVNAVNQAGNSALHSAAASGYNTVIQFLTDRGAKLDVKNKSGQTPLGMTADQGAGIINGQLSLKSTADLLRKLGARD